MDVVCGNLLQMTFLSFHVVPSLYTYTILSLWATANRAESGLNAIDRITYDSLPFVWSSGFVANLSRRSPFSSYNKIVRSAVATANRCWLCDHDIPHMRLVWFYVKSGKMSREEKERSIVGTQLNYCITINNPVPVRRLLFSYNLKSFWTTKVNFFTQKKKEFEFTLQRKWFGLKLINTVFERSRMFVVQHISVCLVVTSIKTIRMNCCHGADG